MDYKNGKIYRLVLDETNEEYIGSTTQTLPKRFYSHKSKLKRWLNGDTKVSNYSSFRLFEKGTPQIFLIEDFPCQSKKHLEKRERQVLEQRRKDGIICVNKCIPTRTDKEYKNNEEYRKKQRQKSTDYYHNNKEIIKERKTKPVICDNCGVESNSSHISRHKNSKKCKNFISSL